jgi:RNA recognition motif-containing protein
MVKLFVGGFPLDMAELELVMLVSPYGEVSTIKIVRDKKTGNCKGYAFLEMISREDAERVVDGLNGSAIGDRVLSVQIKEEDPAPKVVPAKSHFAGHSKFTSAPAQTTSLPLKRKRPRRLS